MVPMMAATGIATLVAFHVDGYSIYSARCPPIPRTVRRPRQPTARLSRRPAAIRAGPYQWDRPRAIRGGAWPAGCWLSAAPPRWLSPPRIW